MKVKHIAFVLLAVLSWGCFCLDRVQAQVSGPDVPTSPAAQENPDIKAALELFKKSDFEGALGLVKEACKKNTELRPPRIILAQWFAAAQLNDGVRMSLDMATLEMPDDPEAYILLGDLALKQRERAAANLFFERAAQLVQKYNANPERKRQLEMAVWRNMAALTAAQEDWKRMEQMVDRRIALEGQQPELLRQKAVALFRQKNDQGSYDLLREADTLEPKPQAGQPMKFLPAEAVFSQLYLSRGDEDSRKHARLFLDSALKTYPNEPSVLGLSVSIRMADGDIAGARQLADKLLSENKELLEAKKLVANIALFQKDYLTAEKLFQEVVVISPSDAMATNGLALALCEQGDEAKLKRAAEYAAENVRKDGKNTDFLGTLGWILFKANNMQQAGQVLQQAIAQGTINPQTAYFLAEFQAKSGNVDQAKQVLEAALKNPNPFPKKADAQLLLGELSK